MNYTVVWNPEIEQRLAEIWVFSDERNEIARAAHYVDRILRRRPLDVGESRSGNQRILIESPISVLYEVFEDDRLVRVVELHRISRRQ